MARFEREQSEYIEKVVATNRVSKTVKGGRVMKFSALMWSGVLKSGSPTLKLITSTPCALSSLLFCDMASVAEGDKLFKRSDN